MGGKVVIIHSKSEWDAQVMTNADATYIVDFTATWCGPCRMIGPVFEELSNQFDSVVFLKVDVDEVEQVAAACGISAMPTFQASASPSRPWSGASAALPAHTQTPTCHRAAQPSFPAHAHAGPLRGSLVPQVWKGGQKVDELVGAAKDKLKELVVKYAG